jgi:small ligand-binding sensory domain FIST
MPFAACLSTAPESARALDEVCAAVAGLPAPADLAVAFFRPEHLREAETLSRSLAERLRPRALLGCVGEAVIGNDREVEDGPALAVWLGRWGSDPRSAVAVQTFHLQLERTSEGFSLLGWPDELVGADPATSAMLVLGDPYTFPADFFLHQVNHDYRGLRVMGGMASGVRGRGQCRLLRDGMVLDHGAVGVLLQGRTGLRPIVSQGCRPVGKHMVVTKAGDDVIYELGGRPAFLQLQELWASLSAEEQELFRQGPHIGRVINEFQGEFQRGDFLVRNLHSVDGQTGALRITDRVRVGQTVQFHLRDAASADSDLHALLQLDVSAHEKRPAAALVFSCNGRGTHLFGQPDHDAGAIRAEAGAIPLAGFFAAGELGPVGGLNFVHGFTASVALFEEQGPAAERR